MLTLYEMELCPYCAKVRRLLHTLDIPYKSVMVTKADRSAIAGKTESVPYIEDGDVAMGESADICKYLAETYA